MFNEKKTCPVCGSTYVELYNSRKTTYHCHSCDSYWRDRTGINQQYRNKYRIIDTWNGYTDPDDFPTDGLGDNGY